MDRLDEPDIGSIVAALRHTEPPLVQSRLAAGGRLTRQRTAVDREAALLSGPPATSTGKGDPQRLARWGTSEPVMQSAITPWWTLYPVGLDGPTRRHRASRATMMNRGRATECRRSRAWLHGSVRRGMADGRRATLSRFFSEDAEYCNGPVEHVHGRDAIVADLLCPDDEPGR